ncbi:MAG: glycosyltransferase family 4 protein [Fimbriimonadaceae bacterium]
MRLAVVFDGALGWRSVIGRYRETLPTAGFDCRFYPTGSFRPRVPGMARTRIPVWIWTSAFAGREAIRQAQKDGCEGVLALTQSTALLAPGGIRLTTYGDATWGQLARLGGYGFQPHWQIDLFERIGYRRLRRARAKMLGMSEWYLSELGRSGIPAPRRHLLPAMLDTDRWSRSGPRESGSRLRVVFVGGDFERKGGPLLREVARRLADVADFVYVTSQPFEPGPNERCLVGLAPDSDELVGAIATADVLALPTRADASSHVAIEAGALGLPSVVSAVGGVPELVEHGVAGTVLDTFEVDAWHQALLAYHRNPELVAEQGSRARERVRARHSVEVHMSTLSRILREAFA